MSGLETHINNEIMLIVWCVSGAAAWVKCVAGDLKFLILEQIAAESIALI